MKRSLRISLALVVLLIGLASLFGAASVARDRASYDERRVEQAQSKARQQAVSGAARLDQALTVIKTKADQLLQLLNSGAVTSANALAATQQLLNTSPRLSAIGIAYDRRSPNAPASANNYTTRPGGVVTAGAIPYAYDDPAEPKGHWWRRGIQAGSTWIPPYFDVTTGKSVATYVGRFYGPEAPPGGGPAGVVVFSFALETLSSGVGYSEFGSSGYAFVISRGGSYPDHPTKGVDGAYVSYPIKSYWTGPNTKTFADVVTENGNSAALQILQPDGVGGILDYQDVITGKPAWLFSAPTTQADWVLGFVAIKDVLVAEDTRGRHHNIGIHLLLISAASSLAIAAALVLTRGTATAWLVTAVLTFAPAVGVGVIWHSEITSTELPGGSVKAADETGGFDEYGGLGDLTARIADYTSYLGSISANLKPIEVLAGVFVRSVYQDKESSAWSVSGTVWQRYVNGVPDGVEPGFVFPDAVNPAELEPAYDVQDGKSRTIGWQFSVVVEPQKSLEAYPFDRMAVTLRLAHRSVNQPIILLPDITEYDLILPLVKPGLAPEVEVDGFSMIDAAFGYTSTSINSTLGIPNFTRQRSAPDLTFTMHLKRQFLDPFISQMMQLLAIVALLFAAHVMGTRAGEWSLVVDPTRVSRGLRSRVWRSGIPNGKAWDEVEVDEPASATFYVQSTLVSVLALMFVAIVSHSGLRASIGASQIVYLEFTYFIVYVVLMLVALNSLLFASGRGGRLVHWRSNLFGEMLYWPLVMTMLFGSTLLRFW